MKINELNKYDLYKSYEKYVEEMGLKYMREKCKVICDEYSITTILCYNKSKSKFDPLHMRKSEERNFAFKEFIRQIGFSLMINSIFNIRSKYLILYDKDTFWPETEATLSIKPCDCFDRDIDLFYHNTYINAFKLDVFSDETRSCCICSSNKYLCDKFIQANAESYISDSGDKLPIDLFYQCVGEYIENIYVKVNEIKKFHAYDNSIAVALHANMMYRFLVSFNEQIDYVIFWDNTNKKSIRVLYNEYVECLMMVNCRAAFDDFITSLYQTITIDKSYIQINTDEDKREHHIPRNYLFLSKTFGIEAYSEISYMTSKEFSEWQLKHCKDNYIPGYSSSDEKGMFDDVIKNILKSNMGKYGITISDMVYQQICSSIDCRLRFNYDVFRPSTVYIRYQDLYVYLIENYLTPFEDIDCYPDSRQILMGKIVSVYGDYEYFQL